MIAERRAGNYAFLRYDKLYINNDIYKYDENTQSIDLSQVVELSSHVLIVEIYWLLPRMDSHMVYTLKTHDANNWSPKITETNRNY
ncbi:hypothetical protein DPMN_119938 [Dreissena polymorpha]|uniref:Uncharacterized protein n=1 Tax=Dreissena polymorpha TaxID=45954 RepID=A0A9D4JSD0_DREPO|nr:hypothetical protein DPMN_119938 [Dreissena polymorpha]